MVLSIEMVKHVHDTLTPTASASFNGLDVSNNVLCHELEYPPQILGVVNDSLDSEN